jgi:serine/threonine-protein kinase
MENAPYPIALPRQGELGADDVYVPAGWFVAGGPDAPDGVAKRRLWCDAFVIQRFPVTCAQYLAFLDALLERGEDAHRHVPRQAPQVSGEGSDEPLFELDAASGRYGLGPQGRGDRWEPDWPVTLVTWHDALAYCQWLAGERSQAWRLPAELEWEKAARGVDGRAMPWGDFLEPTWAHMLTSQTSEPRRAAVDAHPVDCSPFGVRGMAGNSRDWCMDLYTRRGPEVRGGVTVLAAPHPSEPGHRVIKGGAWGSAESYCLLAARFGNLPDHRRAQTGLRPARSYRGMIWDTR